MVIVQRLSSVYQSYRMAILTITRNASYRKFLRIHLSLCLRLSLSFSKIHCSSEYLGAMPGHTQNNSQGKAVYFSPHINPFNGKRKTKVRLLFFEKQIKIVNRNMIIKLNNIYLCYPDLIKLAVS